MRVTTGSAAAPAARRRNVRRRSVMTFAPWNAEKFRALLRLRRDRFQMDARQCCPPMGTIAAATMKRTSARPAGSSVVTLSQSCDNAEGAIALSHATAALHQPALLHRGADERREQRMRRKWA